MSKLTLMEVAPQRGNSTCPWKVTLAGKTMEAFATKQKAVAAAVGVAQGMGLPEAPVSLKIKGRDGKVQEERTYPRSADPERTPG
ncbi:MAG TPA: DUF2188 domain-containing protein [Luteimonas sp.]|nr:DUF2188 domain-containing protein [Luteimonas sp.]